MAQFSAISDLKSDVAAPEYSARVIAFRDGLWGGIGRAGRLAVAAFVLALPISLGIALVSHDERGGSSIELSCESSFWSSNAFDPNSISHECGVDGMHCSPFAKPDLAIYFCPEDCEGLVVKGGGDDEYTADSSVCAAAVASGIIHDDSRCVALEFTGARSVFNVGTSDSQVPFGYFPKSMKLRALATDERCDPPSQLYKREQVAALVVTPLLILLAIIAVPQDTIPTYAAFIWLTQTGAWVYASVSLRRAPRMEALVYISTQQLTVCSVLYVCWNTKQLTVPDFNAAPFEFVLYAIGFLLAMNLEQYESLGLDLSFSSEGFALTTTAIVLLCIIGVVVVCVLSIQLSAFKAEQTLHKYCAVYGLIFSIYIIIGAADPRLGFHFHHYMLGLAGIPLTRVTRFTYAPTAVTIAQAACVGLFVHGVSIWEPDAWWIFDGVGVAGAPPLLFNTPTITNVSLTNEILLVNWTRSYCELTACYGALLCEGYEEHAAQLDAATFEPLRFALEVNGVVRTYDASSYTHSHALKEGEVESPWYTIKLGYEDAISGTLIMNSTLISSLRGTTSTCESANVIDAFTIHAQTTNPTR